MTNPLIWKERVDATATGGVTYYGYSPSGGDEDSAEWLIKRVTRTGDDVVEHWAVSDAGDDADRPNKVWDNRAGYDYE